MASDRNQAKRDVAPESSESSEPAELATVLSSGTALRQELASKKEDHRHIETMKDKEIEASNLGLFGRYLGGAKNAPTAIAALAVLLTLMMTSYCLYVAAGSAKPETWFHEAEALGAIVTLSLGYIFGKGSKST